MSTSVVNTKLGEVHIGGINAVATFTYITGASSTLGAGFSISGSYGSFSSSGTVTRSWSAPNQFTPVSKSQSRSFYTNFQYGKYKTKCYRSDIGAHDYWYEYAFKPIQFWGGGSAVPVSPRTSSLCSYYTTNHVYGVDRVTAYEWSTGAATAGTIGVNLSSRTGHTSSSKISITMKQAGWVCAVAGATPGTATIPYVKP